MEFASEIDINHAASSPALTVYNWPVLKVDLAKCPRRLAYSCSLDGFYLLDSSSVVSLTAIHRVLTSPPSTEPPFDRHDWIVRRPRTNEEVRYVIDYYSAPPESDGSPAFSLDVRPALDSFSSIKNRISVATEEAWTQFKSRQTDGKS
jgi:Cytochrome c/c1 heme lyase